MNMHTYAPLRRRLCVTLSVGLVCMQIPAARAESAPTESTTPAPDAPTIEASRSLWRPEWRKVSVAEVSVFAGLGAVFAIGSLAVKSPSSPKWTGPILFDNGVRNALRAPGQTARDNIALATDVMEIVM